MRNFPWTVSGEGTPKFKQNAVGYGRLYHRYRHLANWTKHDSDPSVMRQVARLSLRKTRDALHHGKRQNIETVT